MDALKISIAKDFSITPGPRYIIEGPFSGELFRNTILESRFTAAREAGVKLIVDLDRTCGYGTSFLEEVFGGLARKYSIKEVQDTIVIISNEETYLKDDIDEYVKNALSKP